MNHQPRAPEAGGPGGHWPPHFSALPHIFAAADAVEHSTNPVSIILLYSKVASKTRSDLAVYILLCLIVIFNLISYRHF